MRTLVPILAFVLGAATTLAVQSRADSPSPPPRAAAVLAEGTPPVRVAPSGRARIQILGHGDHAFVGILSMDAGARVPEHRDASEEFVYVLSGSGRVTIDGREHAVGPGASIYMPARVPVSFVNDDAPMRVLQVFAGTESAAKYDAWAPLDASGPAEGVKKRP